MASLRQYLEKIKCGRSINYDQFVAKLPNHFRSNANRFFDAKLISAKPKRWVVSCDNTIFDELWKLTEPVQGRVHASQKGNSHNHRVTANLVMVYHEKSRNQIPDVVYISRSQVIQNFEPQTRLLLIENEENFIRYEEFCGVISDFSGGLVCIDNTNIAFGAGNRATSNLLINWYESYTKILCAFDYDLGGLRMFETLYKQLGGRVKLVQPSEYGSIIKLFKKTPESDEKLIKAIKLAKSLGFEKLAWAMSETRCFMEQETLLKGI